MFYVSFNPYKSTITLNRYTNNQSKVAIVLHLESICYILKTYLWLVGNLNTSKKHNQIWMKKGGKNYVTGANPWSLLRVLLGFWSQIEVILGQFPTTNGTVAPFRYLLNLAVSFHPLILSSNQSSYKIKNRIIFVYKDIVIL